MSSEIGSWVENNSYRNLNKWCFSSLEWPILTIFFAGLVRLPPVREWVWSKRGIFTALSAAGRRNGRWSACLVPWSNCGKLAGGQHWALEAGSKLGVNKTMSPWVPGGLPWPLEEDQGRTQPWPRLLRWRLFLSRAAASMHLQRCHHQKKTRSKRSVRENVLNVDPLTLAATFSFSPARCHWCFDFCLDHNLFDMSLRVTPWTTV